MEFVGFCGIRIFKTMIQSQTGTMAMNLLPNREISQCHGKQRQKYRNGSILRKLKVFAAESRYTQIDYKSNQYIQYIPYIFKLFCRRTKNCFEFKNQVFEAANT